MPIGNSSNVERGKHRLNAVRCPSAVPTRAVAPASQLLATDAQMASQTLQDSACFQSRGFSTTVELPDVVECVTAIDQRRRDLPSRKVIMNLSRKICRGVSELGFCLRANVTRCRAEPPNSGLTRV